MHFGPCPKWPPVSLSLEGIEGCAVGRPLCETCVTGVSISASAKQTEKQSMYMSCWFDAPLHCPVYTVVMTLLSSLGHHVMEPTARTLMRRAGHSMSAYVYLGFGKFDIGGPQSLPLGTHILLILKPLVLVGRAGLLTILQSNCGQFLSGTL